MSLLTMKRRLESYGGFTVQDRMIKDKLNSLKYAIKNSYQSATFNKYPDKENEFLGLFNPVTHNMDYDTKMISTDFSNKVSVGDILYWKNTKTYWICYAQDLTELAYFRGECRRCNYQIKWVDKNRHLNTVYASIIGPTQPDYRTYYYSKSASIDVATADLVVLVQDNEVNISFFVQNNFFVLKGKTNKIHQVDNISMSGIIQLNCIQDSTNLIDDDVEKNIRNNWNIQPVIPESSTDIGIEGDSAIKPLFPYTYHGIKKGGVWSIVENTNPNKPLPILAENNEWTKQSITIKWDNVYSGHFTLRYTAADGSVFEKPIIVESLM